jgi:plastocyanin
MKKIYYIFSLAAILMVNSASAVVVTINQSGNTFTPNNVTTVNVGDVIHFVWSGGTHTTTSVLVPAGAATWDEPLDMTNSSYDYEVTVAGTYGYHCIYHQLMVGGFVASAPNNIEPNLTSTAEFVAGVDFNSHTLHLTVDNTSPSHATLRMMDITGKVVAELFDTELSMGQQKFHYDVANRTAGVYFLRLEQNGKVVTRRILLN